MFDARKQLRWSKLKIGLIVSLALLTLLIAIFFAGNIQEIFSPKAVLKIQFKDVKGLRKGAPVWIFGTEVGSVKKISLSPAHGAIVSISINREALDFLKKDARATVMSMGLLGDKYVELSSGSPEAERIRPKEMIQGVSQIEFTEVMETAAVSIGKMGEFITKLDTLLTKLETGGTIAKLFSDPTVYDNLEKTSRTLSRLVTDIRDSQGTLKKVIEDPSLYDKMLAAASTIEELSRRINETPGTLKKLVEDPSLYDKMLAAVSTIEELSRRMSETPGTLKKLVEDPSLYNKTLDVVSSFEEFGRKLSGSSGTLNKLLEDPSLYDRILAAAAQLEEFVGKMNEGPGTLRRIIEDPELYENLKKGSGQLSSILDKINQGQGVAGSLITDDALIKEMKETIAGLRDLMKDIKDHPKKYFKFSLF